MHTNHHQESAKKQCIQHLSPVQHTELGPWDLQCQTSYARHTLSPIVQEGMKERSTWAQSLLSSVYNLSTLLPVLKIVHWLKLYML